MGGGELARVVGSRYWREADARVVVRAWRRSGLTAAEFGRKHGVSPRRLLRWAGGSAHGDVSPPVSFVELAVGGGPGAPGGPPDALDVVVGDAIVRVPATFDSGHLAAVVRALRGASC